MNTEPTRDASGAFRWPTPEALEEWRERINSEIRDIESKAPLPWSWRVRNLARPLKRMIGSITVLVSFSLLPALVMIMGYLAVEWIRGSRPTGSLHLLLVGACISGIYVVLFIATAGLVESWRKCSISFPDIGFRRIRQSWLSMSDTLRGRDPLDRVVIAYSRDRLEHDPPDPRMGRAAQLAWVVRAVRRIANDMPEFRDELIAAEFRANALAAEAGLTGDEWRSLVERPGKLLCPGSIDRSWDL